MTSILYNRDRNAYSRWDFAEDRKDFYKWVDSPGPCRDSYWYFDRLKGTLVIEICKRGGRICYSISLKELWCYNVEWRSVVAHVVRTLRHKLWLEGSKRS